MTERHIITYYPIFHHLKKNLCINNMEIITQKHRGVITPVKMYQVIIPCATKQLDVTKSRKRKKVGFHHTDSVQIFSDNIRRRMSSAYYRGLVTRCVEAQKELFSILNRVTGDGFSPLYEDPDEDPLKVKNPDISWDEDESPIEFLHGIKKTPSDIRKVVNVLERSVCDATTDNVVTISLKSISFQGFLTVRVSGKPFTVPKVPIENLVCPPVMIVKTVQITQFIIQGDATSSGTDEEVIIEEADNAKNYLNDEDMSDLLQSINSFSSMSLGTMFD